MRTDHNNQSSQPQSRCPRCAGTLVRDAAGEVSCLNCGYYPSPLAAVLSALAPACLSPLAVPATVERYRGRWER